MKVIGITGGVGAGKSTVLGYIETHYKAKILYADTMAKELQQKGRPLYEPVLELLGRDVLGPDEEIDKAKMAKKIYENPILLQQINDLIHPAVVKAITDEIAAMRKCPKVDYFFIEAALLIENGFDKICDELWYIFAKDEVRIKRLMESRGYSAEKCKQIMASQLDEASFRKACKVVIENSGVQSDTWRQIDAILEGYFVTV